MLAYVFWHRPRREVEPRRYEEALVAYHAALGREAIDGVHGSHAFRADAVPWLGDAAGYEDWYLMEGSYAIDNLNLAAVTGQLEEPHRAVASLCGRMAAGLYELVQGDSALGELALWLKDEPEGARGSVWRRRMVLGPTPEFCLLTDSGLGETVVRRTQLA